MSKFGITVSGRAIEQANSIRHALTKSSTFIDKSKTNNQTTIEEKFKQAYLSGKFTPKEQKKSSEKVSYNAFNYECVQYNDSLFLSNQKVETALLNQEFSAEEFKPFAVRFILNLDNKTKYVKQQKLLKQVKEEPKKLLQLQRQSSLEMEDFKPVVGKFTQRVSMERSAGSLIMHNWYSGDTERMVAELHERNSLAFKKTKKIKLGAEEVNRQSASLGEHELRQVFRSKENMENIKENAVNKVLLSKFMEVSQKLKPFSKNFLRGSGLSM